MKQKFRFDPILLLRTWAPKLVTLTLDVHSLSTVNEQTIRDHWQCIASMQSSLKSLHLLNFFKSPAPEHVATLSQLEQFTLVEDRPQLENPTYIGLGRVLSQLGPSLRVLRLNHEPPEDVPELQLLESAVQRLASNVIQLTLSSEESYELGAFVGKFHQLTHLDLSPLGSFSVRIRSIH